MKKRSELWAEMKPVLKEISDAMIHADMLHEEARMLPMLATGHFLGVAVAMFKHAKPEIATLPSSQVAAIIMEMVLPLLDEIPPHLHN